MPLLDLACPWVEGDSTNQKKPVSTLVPLWWWCIGGAAVDEKTYTAENVCSVGRYLFLALNY